MTRGHKEEKMKRRTRERELHQEGDSMKMTEAIRWAQRHNLSVVRATDYALQIEGYNYWPEVGTIQRADCKKEKERGLRGLAKLLEINENAVHFDAFDNPSPLK